MTGEVKIKVFGLNILINSLRKISPKNPEIGDEPVADFAREMPTVLAGIPYPPELPEQKYVRTFNLKNSWDAEPQGFGRYEIINTARNPKTGDLYAGWVVGVDQAAIHKGRWWQAGKIVRKIAFEIFGVEMKKIFSKLWGK